VNYFLAVFGETLQRMDDPKARYSIALPDMAQYRGLWERLPGLAKKRTGITLLVWRSWGSRLARASALRAAAGLASVVNSRGHPVAQR